MNSPVFAFSNHEEPGYRTRVARLPKDRIEPANHG